MPSRPSRRIAAAALAAVAALSLSACTSGHEVDFATEVRPILNARCLKCHGGVKRAGGVSLLFRDEALAKGESGRTPIVPGDADASELMRRILHEDPAERMPRDDDPLTAEEIDVLRRWIDQGAEWQPHWAFVAPSEAEPPETDGAWGDGGIDAFVLARLEAEGLEPSPEADCDVLARRVALDLTGLPPTPQQVGRVCEGGYEAVVDELLADPAYGERWAGMWLDLARYADSQGFEKDGPRSIWRWRDWVVTSFNDDKPFDRFTVEQLAGDLLPDATDETRLATAFHRNTMTNDEGGTDDEEYRSATVIDRVNTTWEVWQGSTFACTQCHGHPYDPFRHEEYYGVYAFFNQTADWDQTSEFPTLDSFDEGRRAEGERLVAAIADVEARMMEAVSTPAMDAEIAAWTQRLGDPAETGRVQTFWQNELLRVVGRPDSMRSGADRAFLRYVYAEIADATEPLRKERGELYRAYWPLEPVRTPVLRELPAGARRATYVFDRGNFLVRGPEVAPAVPASMPPLPGDAPRNRLGLAEWLVSDGNPLTARVLVNRFWEQLFGTGIVETVEDFGTQGLTPSHPELLDWLAIRFREHHAWSVKGLLREIVTSATYRQSSRVTPELLERDPANRLLARGPRFRLSAEQLRDQALAVSGLLSRKMYGRPVMPPQPEGIWRNPYSGLQWVTATDENRYRRALYTFWRRTGPYPSMMAFDAPSREVCVSRRIRTNTPLQALVTLNDPAFVEAAEALAERVKRESAPASGARDLAAAVYRAALFREPSATKLDALAEVAESSPGDEGLRLVANVVLNLDEFVTKE